MLQVGNFFRHFHQQSPDTIEASLAFFHTPQHGPVVCIGCSAFDAADAGPVQEWYDKVCGKGRIEAFNSKTSAKKPCARKDLVL